MTDEEITRLRELAEASARWQSGPWDPEEVHAGIRHLARNVDWYGENTAPNRDVPGRDDGQYIAAAHPAAVLSLLDALAACRKERDEAVAHRAATNEEIKKLHAVIKSRGMCVEDSVSLHEFKKAYEAERDHRVTAIFERDAAVARAERAEAEVAKVSALYTECELALHEVVPPMADASHFRNAVASVVARVRGLQSDLDMAVARAERAEAEEYETATRFTNAISANALRESVLEVQRDAALARLAAVVAAVRAEAQRQDHEAQRYDLGPARQSHGAIADRLYAIADAAERKEEP